MSFELFDSYKPENNSITDNSELLKTNKPEQGLTYEHLENPEKLGGTSESSEMTDNIIGTPEKDSESWHVQDGMNSCAVCCQEFVAEQLLGEEFSEEQFCELANKKGWYDENTGTSMNDVGKILEEYGLNVERTQGATLNDLAEDLKNGNKLICGVNAGVLENPELARISGIRANHAVQVIGIDTSNPKDIKIILNDSGVQNGKGRVVSAETFMKAWNTSDNFVASVSRKGE